MLSIADFAKRNPLRSQRTCWACSLPQRKEIDAALRAGVSTLHVIRWLTDEVKMSPSVARRPRMDYHFKSNHHMLDR